jgi:hypothetical protein
MWPPGKQIVPPAATLAPRRITRNFSSRRVMAITPRLRPRLRFAVLSVLIDRSSVTSTAWPQTLPAGIE